MRIQKANINLFGLSGVVAFGLLVALLLCPTGVGEVQAADGQDNIMTLAKVDVKPSISIATAQKVSLEVTPQSTKTFQSSTTDLFVNTNSPKGYSIYMATVDGTQNLKYQDNSVDAQIGPTTAGVKEANFPVNTWGYSISSGDDKTYQPVPSALNTAIEQTTTSSTSNHYDLTFGVMIDTSIPAGQYSNLVTISAVANPVTVNSLLDLTYMQQMTNVICDNTVSTDPQNPATKQLIDTRDGKSYWVAKLADGRCWMTQNLALDIKINDAGVSNVRAADSDVDSDWTLVPAGGGWTKTPITTGVQGGVPYDTYTNGSKVYYPPVETTTDLPNTMGNESQVTTYSWNVGKYVTANPSASVACREDYDLQYCTTQYYGGLVAIADAMSPTFKATETAAVSSDGKSYDPHYLLGNYYQWNAATAGTGGTITNADASGSICPKGWTLPEGGGNNVGFAWLLSKYGISNQVTGTANGKNYNISLAPLYFVRSGRITMDPGSVIIDDDEEVDTVSSISMGSSGLYWSSRADDDRISDAYDLWFGSSQLIANDNYDRSEGYTVRCINNPSI